MVSSSGPKQWKICTFGLAKLRARAAGTVTGNGDVRHTSILPCLEVLGISRLPDTRHFARAHRSRPALFFRV